jgi:hypothetical protein
MRLLLLAAFLFSGAESQKRWRESLLDQARQRILTWYPDTSLVEPPETRDGINLRMLKQDQSCGGDVVPVTFADFHVKGVRPIDIFNTMLDTPNQKSWNPQMSSVRSLGDWKTDGARAWAVVFSIPLINDHEFVQWQVADANFTSEEFWLVFSTQRNDRLKQTSPIQAGATESQNCLGAYRITKHPEGAHVIITQHVNAHPFFPIPLHQVLKIFPIAWSATLDFVHEMSENSKKLAAVGTPYNFTVAPRYMLQGPAEASTDQSTKSPSFPIVGRAENFPALQSRKKSRSAFLGSNLSMVLVACAVVAFAVIGIGLGRFTARKIDTMMNANRFTAVDSRDLSRATSFDTARSGGSAFRPDSLEGEALLL